MRSEFKGIFLVQWVWNSIGRTVPLCFASIAVENDSDWLWFMEYLGNAHNDVLPDETTITFLSDCEKGLVIGVKEVFPGANQ